MAQCMVPPHPEDGDGSYMQIDKNQIIEVCVYPYVHTYTHGKGRFGGPFFTVF